MTCVCFCCYCIKSTFLNKYIYFTCSASTRLADDIDVVETRRNVTKATGHNITHRHSDVPQCSTDELTRSTTSSSTSVIVAEPNAINANSNHHAAASTSSTTSSHRLMRPRFNTLELDLSCSKNKFPITDRRKQIQQLIRDKDHKSAPATPNDWTFQTARNTDVHGFLGNMSNASPSNAAVATDSATNVQPPTANGKPAQSTTTLAQSKTITTNTMAAPPTLT